VRNLLDVEPTRRMVAQRPVSGRVPIMELAATFRGLAVLLDCGIPVERGLLLLSEGAESPALREALRLASVTVRSGHALSEAFGRQARVFRPLTVALVRAGEASGRLHVMMHRLADHLEKHNRLDMKVRSALTYPVLLSVICLGVVVILPTFLMNGIFGLLRELGTPLPLPTRALMALGAVLSSPWFWLGMAALLFAARHGGRRVLRREPSRRRWDRALLRLPTAGRLLRNIASAHFVTTFETLFSCGVPLVQAVQLAAGATGNRHAESTLCAAAMRLQDGHSLHDVLATGDLLTPVQLQFIKAGEESGDLPAMLRAIHRLAEDDVEAHLASLVAMLEPLMLWLMGGVVAFISLAALQPLLKAIQSLAL
jgi:type II secretory pathway component PulF